MKIALVSLDQMWEDKEANFRICEEYLKSAVSFGSELVVFPEMTLTGFSMNLDVIAEDKNELVSLERFKVLAKAHNVAIVFGMVVKNGLKAENRSYFLDQNGKVLGQYTKIHPFSFAGEDDYYIGGNTLVSINFKDLEIGLSICYDLRFPEVYTALGRKCDLIINIANWPEKRIDHWKTLLKARAIENQLFMVGVNRVGIDGNNLKYVQSSDIYDPNGEILTYNLWKDMKIVELDNKKRVEFKNLFTTVNDRKPNMYKGMI